MSQFGTANSQPPMNQFIQAGSSNVTLVAQEFKQVRTHWKWLFEIRTADFPEVCIALLTQEKMHEYADKLRAKGWEVSIWNISEIEEDPLSTLDELLTNG